VGDTVLVSVDVDSEHVPLNVVEGTISLGASTSTALVTSVQQGSAFPLWPRVPVYDADSNSISFTGGVPGGFNSSNATLFSIILVAKKAGTITLDPTNLSVYKNDGKGTLGTVSGTPLEISVRDAAGGVAAHTPFTPLVWSLGILILIFFLCGAYWYTRRSPQSKNNSSL
jgi:hypothetical protein